VTRQRRIMRNEMIDGITVAKIQLLIQASPGALTHQSRHHRAVQLQARVPETSYVYMMERNI